MLHDVCLDILACPFKTTKLYSHEFRVEDCTLINFAEGKKGKNFLISSLFKLTEWVKTGSVP